MGKMSKVVSQNTFLSHQPGFVGFFPPLYAENITRRKLRVMRLQTKVEGAGLCLFCRVEEELRKLREETNVDSLRQELDRERSKRLELEQKMNEVVKSR